MDGYKERLRRCGIVDEIEFYIHLLEMYYDDRREWA